MCLLLTICLYTFLRELRRSGVKNWLRRLGEVEEYRAEKVIPTPSEYQLSILSSFGLIHQDVDILKHVTLCGSSFRAEEAQVLLHVDAARRQHFGILKLIVRNKNTDKYLLFVEDRRFQLISHLGLYQLLDDGVGTITVLNFEDLTTAEPLNLYAAKDNDGGDVFFVSLKEALMYEC